MTGDGLLVSVVVFLLLPDGDDDNGLPVEFDERDDVEFLLLLLSEGDDEVVLRPREDETAAGEVVVICVVVGLLLLRNDDVVGNVVAVGDDVVAAKAADCERLRGDARPDRVGLRRGLFLDGFPSDLGDLFTESTTRKSP